jgi:DNA-binding IclR family transcriptional regulator
MKIETVPEQKTTIQVIERMVALLDALAKYPDPVSLKELSKVSGLHPSTAHRILNDMVLTRFVDRIEPGTYRLGMRLLELGNVVKSRLSVREAALDFMRALHKKPSRPSTCRCARATRSSTSTARSRNARACRWCARSAAAARCT